VNEKTNAANGPFWAVTYRCFTESGNASNGKLLVQATTADLAKSEAEKILSARGKRYPKASIALQV